MSISFSPGTIIDDRYSIIEQLGEGGMGTVFKAREVGLDRLVALKVLHSTLAGDNQNQTRFKREGKVLGTLMHGNIIQLYRFGIWNKTFPYIAMEFFEGRSLISVIDKETRLPASRVLSVALQVCSAMEAAHAAGVVHRDLSPANIMLPLTGDSPCKVIDFGLSMFAKSDVTADQKLTRTGTVVGSIYYMSPEQCTGTKADQRSDIYSLGCVLYHALTGTTPFSADNPIALMRQHTSVYPKNLSAHIPPSEIPAGLDNALFRAMAKVPVERYQTMREFRTDLELIIAGAGGRIDLPNNLPGALPATSRRVAPMLLTAMLLLLVVVPLAFLIQQGPFQRATRGKLATTQIEEKSTLRRLRQKRELDRTSPGERINYYRNWLASYPNDTSIDAATARQDLAFNLDITVPDATLDAKLLYSQAFKLCPAILDQSLRVRDPDLAETAVRTAFNCGTNSNESSTKEVLLEMLSKLEHSGATGMLRAANGCREYIADISMEGGDYVTAEKMLRAQLKSSTEAAVVPKDHLRRMVALAKCLRRAKKNEDAKITLIDAIAFAAKNYQQTPETALNLAELCFQANLLPECLTAADLAIEATPRAGKDEKTLLKAYELKSGALESMHEYEKSYQFLSNKLETVADLHGRLAWWQILCRLNYEGQLGKEEQLKSILAHEVSLIPKKNPEESIVAIFQAVQKTAREVRRGGNNEFAIAIVSIAASTSSHWTKENMLRLTDPLITLLAEARPLLNGALTLQIYKLVKAKVDESPDSYIQKSHLAIFYANQFGAPPNSAVALEGVNTFLEGDAKQHEQLHPREYQALLMVRARLLRMLNRVTESRRAAEEALVLARTIVKDQLPVVLSELATVELATENPDKAVTLYREALQNCDPTFLTSQLHLRLSLAHALIVDKKFAEAEVILQECLELGKKAPHPHTLFLTRSHFMDLYNLSGQKEKAAELRKPYEEAKAALFNPPAFPK